MFKKWSFPAFFSLFLAISLLFSALSFTFLKDSKDLPTNAVAREERVIVIDAGHGGIDGGATGANGVTEKDLNLAVASKLAAFFRMAGYTVVETRTTDVSLADADAKKGHVKQSDLTNRLKILNQYPKSILISIHMNAYPGVACSGLQVWYSQNNDLSAELANAVQGGVKSVLQPQNNRKTKVATTSIYLLRHAENPAILIECGFISNLEECERLATPSYQKELALAIFASLYKKI
ncbi:MAG: N-acetylmuramoyl-L-alanine amidase [Clostridia bacterium]|nr:N-acetylmuramoyl-L-alanine amidase [Clostridia bacterium]MBR3863425.1 N-acetylmuramoyl-L-alanine amidase [Clostridia bacterium]